jgi:S-adenosylmethionine:tRNA ribosyltransferase-isomerase
MKTADFDYFLPPERIAQTPVEPRHNSKLLVLDRQSNSLEHSIFWNLGDYLNSGDLLVLNRTRVILARIHAFKPSGGKVEILLISKKDALTWEILVGGKKMVRGQKISIINGPDGEVIEVLDGSRRLMRFNHPIEADLTQIGEMPLPPYIHTKLQNPERYQTIYAKETGSVAAPTAGLHFTKELMEKLKDKGIQFAEVTLHVGLDTFAPVTEEDPIKHQIHTEWCRVTTEAAKIINQTRKKGHRIVAVGTTSVRTLESAARAATGSEAVAEYTGSTDLFILPGYNFKAVDAMVTNFHLPKSTLLMMVSAFAGKDRILSVYEEAIRKEYRFYSFGDAMLIL